MTEALIESCQFIGWWRDAAPDALTSSAYTGERTIYSSDFSAFTKRLYCPSVLRFSGPKILYFGHRFSICTSATAYSGTLFPSRWSAMEYRRCQPPCTRFIASVDPHSKCVNCLGFSHAREAVYGISKCTFCENLRLKTLRSRLEVLEKESSVFPRRAPEASAASREPATWGSDVELEEMESEQTGLAFSLPPSAEHVCANLPVEFEHEYLYPSPGARDTVSFGLDDILLTAASDSEDFGPALADALPPSGQEARPSAAYSELMDMLSRATEKLALDWPDEPHESQASKLDERFLSGPNSRPERRKLPFLRDLHQEISRSWKQPFFSRLTNAAAADFTNLVGSVEQGYTAMPVVEDTLASRLSPSLAPSWKSRPLLPTKPCRTTSALIGKSYIAAGQAGMALHTMAILQAYRADVLKEMDEGTSLTPEAVKELRRATVLALRATEHTACAVGRSMAGSVAAECHLWLNLTEICEKEKVLLLDAPISQSGLFGEAVSSVVEKFRSAKTQSAALKQFMPRRMRDHSTPSSSLSREQSLPRKEPSGRSGAQAVHPPTTTVWGARGRPFPRQRPRRRVDLKRPNRPAASAPPSRFWPSSQNEESYFTAARPNRKLELELRAVFLALMYFLPVLGGHHIIVRTDNMAVVSHINRQGGSRSRTLDRLARLLLLWSQDKFLSLRAGHVPGILNLAADFLSRQKLRPGEWMLYRQTVSQIWNLFGKAEVDLFASQGSSQCRSGSPWVSWWVWA